MEVSKDEERLLELEKDNSTCDVASVNDLPNLKRFKLTSTSSPLIDGGLSGKENSRPFEDQPGVLTAFTSQ